MSSAQDKLDALAAKLRGPATNTRRSGGGNSNNDWNNSNNQKGAGKNSFGKGKNNEKGGGKGKSKGGSKPGKGDGGKNKGFSQQPQIQIPPPPPPPPHQVANSSSSMAPPLGAPAKKPVGWGGESSNQNAQDKLDALAQKLRGGPSGPSPGNSANNTPKTRPSDS